MFKSRAADVPVKNHSPGNRLIENDVLCIYLADLCCYRIVHPLQISPASNPRKDELWLFKDVASKGFVHNLVPDYPWNALELLCCFHPEACEVVKHTMFVVVDVLVGSRGCDRERIL